MPDRGEFPTTHWSLVVKAGGDSSDAKLRALSLLLQDYLPPLRAYLVYAKGFDSQYADDLLQSFVADQILERDLLKAAEQARGRFRSFIVTALDNFVSNQRRYDRAKKRSPPGKVSMEEAFSIPDQGVSPAEVFDLVWAREVLAKATHLMRAHCARSRPELWQIFESRVLNPALKGETPLPYGEMVKQYGFVSPTQAANAVVTANRMFARMLREVIGRYEKNAIEVEDELRDLRKTIASLAAKRGAPGDGNITQ